MIENLYIKINNIKKKKKKQFIINMSRSKTIINYFLRFDDNCLSKHLGHGNEICFNE